MGPIQRGRWEGVAPVAGTFLVFLRNFSEGLRNAGACESKCPADRDAFVLQRARERGTQHRLRHANQCNLFRSGNKTPNRRAIKTPKYKR